MKAFHGDPAVKEKYLARLKARHAADEIIQGTGWENGHGCAVGCTLNQYNHKAYENELGLPRWLAHLEDRIFEGLPAGDAQRFAVDFLESIPVGADVEKVKWLLAVQRHTRDRDRLMENPEPYAKQCVDALNQVIAYCESQISGNAAARAAWSAAWSAARSAAREARSAAWSAARSARSAAESAARAAWSAAWSAESAESAWSAAESAAWSAARAAARAAWSAAWSAESAAESAWSAAESAAESAWSAARSAWSAAWSAESAAESAESAESARSAWSAAESAAESAHFKWEAETLLELLRNAPQATE